jgi:aspartate kinase
MEHVVVRGAALSPHEVRVTMRDVPDRPGVVHGIFSRLAAANIVVDMIVQNIAVEGRTSVSFTTAEHDLPHTLALTEEAAREIAAGRVDYSTDVAKLSVVGLGMRVHSGVADRMFRALAEIGVNIQLITTSEIKISVLVDLARGVEALRAVHDEFSLHERQSEFNADPRYLAKTRTSSPSADAEERLREIARNVPRMEDILVTDVELDENQGRVTLWGVPDRPGVAASVFAAVAAAGVAVDMIVQGVGDDGSTHLTFTTALRTDLEAALEQARKALPASAKTDADAQMAKLSVRGVGMRSHSSVAVRMFRALTDAGVNIQLINTSELHITVVVRQSDGARALEALRKEFGLSGPAAVNKLPAGGVG